MILYVMKLHLGTIIVEIMRFWLCVLKFSWNSELLESCACSGTVEDAAFLLKWNQELLYLILQKQYSPDPYSFFRSYVRLVRLHSLWYLDIRIFATWLFCASTRQCRDIVLSSHKLSIIRRISLQDQTYEKLSLYTISCLSWVCWR